MSAAAEPRAAAGFTLLELLAALAVALILLAAAPRLVAPEAGALDRAARLAAAELRAARAAAFATGAPQAVAIDAKAGALRRDGAEPAFLPEGVALAAVTAAEVEAATGAPGVLFFPEGGATGAEIRLTRGEATARVSVRWLTGAVRVE